MEMAGIECPRYADLQMAAFGHRLETHWRDYNWKRGDIVFFENHVGLMASSARVLHADPIAKIVTVAPLVDLVLQGSNVIGVGRPG
jgi:cell wall-associated NlpC family hydrolase